ncbi:hypothetical protein [Streptomyces sp. NPDC037389]|uniref:hypothetical protein n=1 Tax=Streptomyces sp. NPDC037389 TaxID=3155369 RepID=UPI0033DD1E3F
MGWARKAMVTAGAVALAVGGGIATGGTAWAGTNGQQIVYHKSGDNHTRSVRVSGTNQSGARVARCFDTPGSGNWFAGWWWKGDVTFDRFGGSGCTGSHVDGFGLTVPVSQSEDWYHVWD